jgi:hypothetical protein
VDDIFKGIVFVVFFVWVLGIIINSRQQKQVRKQLVLKELERRRRVDILYGRQDCE